MKRWQRLNDQQLIGAFYALRLLSTSVRIKGAALDLLKDLIEEIYEEMKTRPGLRVE